MNSLLTRLIDGTLEALLSRDQRARLGRHLLNRARGEGNGDPYTNGEYALLQQVKTHWVVEGTCPVIFDVGSNVGDWALEAVRGLPASTKLFVFEPSASTFETLRAQMSRVGVHVIAHNFAVGDSESIAPLYVDVHSQIAETNSLHKRRAEVYFNLQQQPAEEVRIRRGDAVATEAGIDRIHLLKIDTEGHEVSVLNGFSSMLAEERIDLIQFEYGSTWADARTMLVDAFDLLQLHGYHLAKLHPEGVEFFPRYDQREETYAFANYVAVRPDLATILSTVRLGCRNHGSYTRYSFPGFWSLIGMKKSMPLLTQRSGYILFFPFLKIAMRRVG